MCCILYTPFISIPRLLLQRVPRLHQALPWHRWDPAALQPALGIKQTGIFQLEGTYNNHLIQLSEPFRADQKLKLILKAIVQMPL